MLELVHTLEEQRFDDPALPAGTRCILERDALPAALHALGATTDEVEAAMQRGKEKLDKQCACEDEDRALAQEDQKLNMKERTLGLKKTEADIKKTEHDAKAPYTSASSGSSGGGSK